MSARRALDQNMPSGEHNLVEWAKPYLTSKRRIFQVMDARIEGQYPVNEAMKVANLANRCLSTEPKLRPTMEEVVRALEQLQDSKDIEGVGHSQNVTHQSNNHNSSSGPRYHRKSATENYNGGVSNMTPSASPLRSHT